MLNAIRKLPPQAAVPRQVYLKAKHYVEQQAVPFFDFYRNAAFGFVEVAPRKGHYVQLVLDEQGNLDAHCKCREADFDEVCGHGFAIYLKLINWPLVREDLSEKFESFELCRFFKTTGRALYDLALNPTTNPSLRLKEGVADQRLVEYLGFGGPETPLSRRDRQAQETAKRKVRPMEEWIMLRKQFPSARVLFEESRLYALCKLLFFIDRERGLKVRVSEGDSHRVVLSIGTGDHELLSWEMPVDAFLKGMQQNWDFWEERCDFDVRRQGVPITYRIQFTAENDLEVEPMLSAGPEVHVPLGEVGLPGHKNLNFHPKLGYFRLQTGLSPFEMTYSEPGVSVIHHQEVARFLKQHLATLENLDRSLMDEALFGEVVAEKFDNFRLNLDAFEPKGFTYHLEARLGEHQVALDDLRRLFRERGRYRKIGGKLFDTAGYDGVYLKAFCELEKAAINLPVGDLFRLLMFFRDRLNVETSELTAKIYQSLKEFQMPELPSLEHTRLTLRAYQELGYEWLYFLKTHGLGGLLCDQMGLGKTHQGMALIAALLSEDPAARVLVVAPTSVLFHWKDKLGEFCPGIEKTIHHGLDRDAQKALEEAQVIISSYGTMRNDIDHFRNRAFDLVIFDEIQYLKNKKTKSYGELSQLNGLCKIGLTGTPIENHVEELKSLMDLVLPGFLGGDAQFRKFFVDPILKFNDSSAKEKVRDMIKPFTLRRSKSQVLQELPPKTEDLRTVTLGKYESELYKEIKGAGKNTIFGPDGKPLGLMHIFQLIDKLKQVCNHPALYFKHPNYAAYPCAKWDMFLELLHEALDSGEKLVVYSQYLGMIDMFKSYLDKEGVGYSVITGQTRDRADQQRRFMEEQGCQVFLGSLRAAGVGIDLTAASIMIHYDRWWNPAREEQATDRIHRIGQNKNVQIYKFKTLGTVEERIDRIISQKRHLLDDVVGFDNDSVAKTFTMDELLEILS